MVAPRYRSRTLRRVFKRTPGSRVSLQYRKRKPSKAHCAECGGILMAVPNERPYKMENMAKTKKRPQRPFGGKLCSSCAKRVAIKEARQISSSSE